MPAGCANFPPPCQVTVAVRRACLGRSSYASCSELWQWQSLCPPNKSGPGLRQPILMLFFKYLAWLPMPGGHLTRAASVPNAQSRGVIGIYGTCFRLFICHPLCPKSKWHVPPPAYGFAYASYSQLCQSLCPPKRSKPNRWRVLWMFKVAQTAKEVAVVTGSLSAEAEPSRTIETRLFKILRFLLSLLLLLLLLYCVCAGACHVCCRPRIYSGVATST